MYKKILISIPDDLFGRLRSTIPLGQRSSIITTLLRQEIEKRESELYQCACEVEADTTLNQEMCEWNSTLSDGLEYETR